MTSIPSTTAHSPSAVTPPLSGHTDKNSNLTRVLKIALPIIASLAGFVFLPFEMAIALTAIVTLGAVIFSGECKSQTPNPPNPNEGTPSDSSQTQENARPERKSKKKAPSISSQSPPNTFEAPQIPPEPSRSNNEMPNPRLMVQPPKSTGDRFVDLPRLPDLPASQPPKTGNCLDDAEVGDNHVKITFASLKEMGLYARRMEFLYRNEWIEPFDHDSTTVFLCLTNKGQINVGTPRNLVKALRNPNLCLDSQNPGFSLVATNRSSPSNPNDPLANAYVYNGYGVNIQFRSLTEEESYQGHLKVMNEKLFISKDKLKDNSVDIFIPSSAIHSGWTPYKVLNALRNPDFCKNVGELSAKAQNLGQRLEKSDFLQCINGV